MAPALGNSGVEQEPRHPGRWKGDARGENSRPRVAAAGAHPCSGPHRALAPGAPFPRYAPLARRPQGPHPRQRRRSVCLSACLSPRGTPRARTRRDRAQAGSTHAPPPALGRKQTAHARLAGTGPGNVLTESRTCTHRPRARVAADAGRPRRPSCRAHGLRLAPPEGAPHPGTLPTLLRPNSVPGHPPPPAIWAVDSGAPTEPAPGTLPGRRTPAASVPHAPSPSPSRARVPHPASRPLPWRPGARGLLSRLAPRCGLPSGPSAGCSEPGSRERRAEFCCGAGGAGGRAKL